MTCCETIEVASAYFAVWFFLFLRRTFCTQVFAARAVFVPHTHTRSHSLPDDFLPAPSSCSCARRRNLFEWYTNGSVIWDERGWITWRRRRSLLFALSFYTGLPLFLLLRFLFRRLLRKRTWIRNHSVSCGTFRLNFFSFSALLAPLAASFGNCAERRRQRGTVVWAPHFHHQ